MTVFVDAIEYEGADLPLLVGGSRRPIRHHAFDTDTGLLAHGASKTRLGFPHPQRSWTSVDETATTCLSCRDAVTSTVGQRIGRLVRLTRACLDAGGAVWLFPPPPPDDKNPPNNRAGTTEETE